MKDMISLLPLNKVIVGISVCYGVFVAIILWCTSDADTTLMESAKVALSGAAVINVILIGILAVGWRWLWFKFPKLNHILFPDLNGVWNIQIHWANDSNSDIAHGTAHIIQDFLKISMEVETDISESETLCATPSKDAKSGRPILYYTYRVIPRHTSTGNSDPYEGCAILKLDHDNSNGLKGNYFTSQKTKGYFELSKV